MNAQVNIQSDLSQQTQTKAEVQVLTKNMEQRNVRLQAGKQKAQATPTYDFVGIAG